ncbi:phosphoenolpyruvate synthase [bacterium]|nr:phosphoenolpyruvate synthase [bacterium]
MHESTVSFVLNSSTSVEEFRRVGGGKAYHLAKLSQARFPVPEWICLSSNAFDVFLEQHGLLSELSLSEQNFAEVEKNVEELFLGKQIPLRVREELVLALELSGLIGSQVAVRSSGLDEDSGDNSFAGQFSSFLFQKGPEAIFKSILRCWASGWSARALAYRSERGLSLTGIRVGVVIQEMINADAAGVAFSRNPVSVSDRDNLMISSVWGLGEGLVSGLLPADEFTVNRKTFESRDELVDKRKALRHAPEGGLVESDVEAGKVSVASLTPSEIRMIAKISLDIEKHFGGPQDIEWALAGGQIHVLQARPITTLPPDGLFDEKCAGSDYVLWDNSNIIESFCGVTTPLTFSHVSRCYQEVYYQFCRLMQVPEKVITENESTFRNMLGLMRGRIYYNLANWYRLLYLFPGTAQSKSFMETMMGVKQGLKPEIAALFDFTSQPVEYSLSARLKLGLTLVSRLFYIRPLIVSFEQRVDSIVAEGRHKNFRKMSLQEQVNYYHSLTDRVLKHWQAPIVNDTRCMVFFGLLKTLVERWISKGDDVSTLQNDLLCGQGDLESTEPTRMLMRIAAEIDNGPENRRSWFMTTTAVEAWKAMLEKGVFPELFLKFKEFLDVYGFRCVNELKLEERDLHDDPSFALEAVASYVRMKSYSIEAMEQREREIRKKAEAQADEKLNGLFGFVKRPLFYWVLSHARSAVRDRENLRFDRTKTFGIVRHLFRGFGANLASLGVIENPEDVFYLTIEEIIAYTEGRSSTLLLKSAAEARKVEFEEYRNSPAPPDRFTTRGAVGASLHWPQLLAANDLLASELPVSDDPNVLLGTACCPGVVEGVVRVVVNMSDAQGLNGEILVTERTDPGWVPLFPACGGLLIERGSLLSHSAVVARELGLPTIVGVRGGLVSRLKSGMRVRMDAGRGEITILHDQNSVSISSGESP